MLKNVSYYLILLFLVCLPFDQFYSSVTLICLTVHTVLTGTKASFRMLLDKRVLVLQALYWLTLLGTVYTRYPGEAVGEWVQQLPLLLWPWLACVLQPVLRERKNELLCAFTASGCAVVLYLFWNAFRTIHYFHMPAGALFSAFFVNHNFSLPLDLHATYLSMYLSLSLVFCLTQIVRGRKPLFILASLVLLAGLVQLASKSVLGATWVVLVIGVPVFLFPARRRAAAFRVTAILTFTLVLGSLLLQASSFRGRIVDDLTKDFVQDRQADPLNEPRMVRWKVAVGLIRSSPLVGYGSGSEMPVLKAAYYQQGLFEPYLYELNTHNQFLRYGMTLGVMGVVAYLGLLGFGFVQAWKHRDLVWTCFLSLATVVSLAENMLDVQKGIFFFSFFISFFFFSSSPKPTKP